MNVIKKIDDIGRIAIPRDLRRALRWMGGDEIEIVTNGDDSLTLRKYQPNFSTRLNDVEVAFIEWTAANDVKPDDEILDSFNNLIKLIQEKEKLESD